MVEFLCDRVGVMYQGQLVELAPRRELYDNPLHPYTKRLLSAVPDPGKYGLKTKESGMKAGGESMLCQADEKTEWIEVLPEHFVRCRKEVGA